MLVLTRKTGESVRIGRDIELRIVGIRGHRVRLAIDAPGEVAIRRTELLADGIADRFQANRRAQGAPPCLELEGVAGAAP